MEYLSGYNQFINKHHEMDSIQSTYSHVWLVEIRCVTALRSSHKSGLSPPAHLKRSEPAQLLRGGGTSPQHDLKFCQFVGASAKGLNIKYLLGWMRSRGDIRFTKIEKVVFSSYFEGSHKNNSYTVPYSYEAFGKNFVYRNLFTVFNSTG